jgi:hypothetical protein
MDIRKVALSDRPEIGGITEQLGILETLKKQRLF